jgi:alkanesulfonate monooxygenase SsuD/methylene tetrahydromethanopterin reductase-like flavin-dependent oxidoreductase (luciferase family)
MVILAHVGARVRRMQLGTDLLILPLHHPIRVAEDAATLSLLTEGRFALGVGLGYRLQEYAAFQRSIRHRPGLLEEGIRILRLAWSGEPFEFHGRHYDFPPIRVTPVPEKAPKLLIGGFTDAAIKRAARLGDGYLGEVPQQCDRYLSEAGPDGAIYSAQRLVITDDPDKTKAQLGPHLLYQANGLIEWGAFGDPAQVPRFEDVDSLLEAGVGPMILDGPAAVEHLTRLCQSYPQIRDIHVFAQYPGESVSRGTARLEYIASEVLPAVRARMETARHRGTQAQEGGLEDGFGYAH